MKRKIVSITLILVIAAILAGCQATPEKDVVIGKSGNLDELIQSTPDVSDVPLDTIGSQNILSTQTNSELYSKLEVPKHWNFEAKVLNDKLNIKADADIVLPGVSQLPAATASLSEFTQEDLEKITNLFGISKEAAWTERSSMTKENIEKMILDNKELIATGKDGLYGAVDAETIAKVKESTEYLEQDYIDAPYESDLEKIDFKIGASDSSNDETFLGFEGTTQVDSQPFYFLASNQYVYDRVTSVYANYGTGLAPFGGVDIDAPDGVSLTMEQAAEQAKEIAAKLTSDLSLCHITPATTGQRDEISRTWGWACVFMREISGCPTAYSTTEIGSMLEAVDLSTTYEKMIIVIDDGGMVSFTWDIPMTIRSVDNQDVSLLPFQEISQRATEQISQRFTDKVTPNVVDGIDWSDPGCTANIKEVQLGLTRVAKINSPDYYYIPVWKFFVELEHTNEYFERTKDTASNDGDVRGPDGYPSNIDYEYSLYSGVEVITINAIDGSVIDGNLGY